MSAVYNSFPEICKIVDLNLLKRGLNRSTLLKGIKVLVADQ